jgi:ATPase subunit of ABC transporter with duplicated ATPase domains
VLVVSHDDGFLRRIAPDLVLELRDGLLRELPHWRDQPDGQARQAKGEADTMSTSMR